MESGAEGGGAGTGVTGAEAARPKMSSSVYGIGRALLLSIEIGNCRDLVRVLVCDAKTTTWDICTACASADPLNPQAKGAQEKERMQYMRSLEFDLPAFDIYTLIAMGNGYQKAPATVTARAKDEEETLDHFATIYTMLNLQNFKEIFSTNIEYLVERVTLNFVLLAIPNSFLVNVGTSPAFCSVLLDFLLARLGELGINSERVMLYVRLFKLVFGSVSFYLQENEHMPAVSSSVRTCFMCAIGLYVV